MRPPARRSRKERHLEQIQRRALYIAIEQYLASQIPTSVTGPMRLRRYEDSARISSAPRYSMLGNIMHKVRKAHYMRSSLNPLALVVILKNSMGFWIKGALTTR